MATLTIADLDNGKRDLETVDAVANSNADFTTTRFGSNVLTLAGALRRLGYMAPVPYASGLNVDSALFTVSRDGVIYAPDPSLVPFTTGVWDAAQWRVVQNVMSDRSLLVYTSKAEAEADAVTIPDGQVVEVGEHRYTVSAGALTDERLSEPLRGDLIDPPGDEPAGGFANIAALEAYRGAAAVAKILSSGQTYHRLPSPIALPDGVLQVNDSSGNTWAMRFEGRAHIKWWIEKYPNHLDALEAAVKTGAPLATAGTDLSFSGLKFFSAPSSVDIDFSGSLVTVGDCRLFISAQAVASNIFLSSDVSRGSRGVSVSGDLSNVAEGDLLHIVANALPSPDWSDKKQDCVTVKSVGVGTITFYDQLNFPYTSGEAGLTVTVYKRASAVIRGLNSQHTHAASPTYGFGIRGFSAVTVDSPNFIGTLPFDPITNIYRTGILIDRCRNISISGTKAKNMAYPIGIYGGSRNITETGTSGEGNHHLNADLGGWSSDYELTGMTGSGNYQGMNTHPCLRANAASVTLCAELGLSNWRSCGGFTLSDIYISGFADDTMELPQFANTNTNPGFEYLNSEADIAIDGFQINHPSRVSKSPLAVRYGRTISYSNVRSPQDIWVGLSNGESDLFIQGPGCIFGAGRSPTVPPNVILSSKWRMDAPAALIFESAQTLRVPDGNVSVALTGSTKIRNLQSSGELGQTVRLFFLNSGVGVEGGGNIVGSPPTVTSGGHVDLIKIEGGNFLIST